MIRAVAAGFVVASARNYALKSEISDATIVALKPLDRVVLSLSYRRARNVVLLFLGLVIGAHCEAIDRIERWGIFEVSLPGPSTGNPFVDITLGAIVSDTAGHSIRVAGVL